MTKRFTGLGAALVSTVFALGVVAAASAVPARADDGLAGTYTVVTKGTPSTWQIESSCSPSCVARIHSSDGWTGYARPGDGRWTMAVYVAHWDKSSYAPDPAYCMANGGNQPMNQNWSWDAVTLAGTVETIRSDQCGGPVTIDRAPIRLVKAGEGDG